jgi:hypothetical protein
MKFSTSDVISLYLAGAVSEAIFPVLALCVWAAATRNPRTWGSVLCWTLLPNLLLAMGFAAAYGTILLARSRSNASVNERTEF